MQRCNPRTAHVMDGTRHREGFTALPFFLPKEKFDSICQTCFVPVSKENLTRDNVQVVVDEG